MLPKNCEVLPALNAMIDIATTRTVAAQTHPPSIIDALMLVSSLLAGHGMAAGRGRNWVHMAAFAATMALALSVILDLEFPRWASSVSTSTTRCWSTCGKA